MVRLGCDVHFMWWVNQELELQEWDDFMKSKKKRILSIIILVPCSNPTGYKEHVICFNVFAFGEDITTLDWLEKMNIYVSEIVESYKDTIT